METCKKVSFDSKEDANRRVKEIDLEEKRDKNPIRSYRCEQCGQWHLTSVSKKTYKHIKKLPEIRKERRINSEAYYWSKKKGWEIIE